MTTDQVTHFEIKCDTRGCPNVYRGTERLGLVVTRHGARRVGWQSSAKNDWCPEHVKDGEPEPDDD